MSLVDAVDRRRTFAIISHPDAGKTTVTEKLLLLGNAIQLAGTVKAKKSTRAAKSDWMAIEQERGISVTTSVMQVNYAGRVVNLLDTPGHEDFSEDTYRTLSAVDSAMMVIDSARGVEPRTRKLLEICRLRDTPIFTFINKLDRESLPPLELIDHIEDELQIECAPESWPIGSGRSFKGIYLFRENVFVRFERGHGAVQHDFEVIPEIESSAAREWLGSDYAALRDEIELVREVGHDFDQQAFLEGTRTPVYFGSALHNFGVREAINRFTSVAPPPQWRATDDGIVDPHEEKFSGFVFKIQANMDPKHRDRIAFVRICSGKFRQGMRVKHVRLQRSIKISNAVTFLAGDRVQAEEAYAGDIIGLHNHGSIQIGDTFTEGADLAFSGIPNFAPELFRSVRVRDPITTKRLEKGIQELSEEGAMQAFTRLTGNQIIVGAIGTLQFDLVAYRLREEYGADCLYESSPIHTVRWVSSPNESALDDFRRRSSSQLAVDSGGHLALLASSRSNLQLAEERWPDIEFAPTREHNASV